MSVTTGGNGAAEPTPTNWLDGHRMQISAVLAVLVALNEAFHWVPPSVENAVIAAATALGVWGLSGKFEKARAATVANTEAVKQVAAATTVAAAVTADAVTIAAAAKETGTS